MLAELNPSTGNAVERPPIYERWPPKHADRIQLYSINSPNGIKVAVALEEMGLEYDPHLVNILEGDQHTAEFRSVSPNGKIPAIINPRGPGGRLITIMESGAILIYLAEKSGTLLPADPIARNQCIQWLFFQVGHIGPMFGQYEHFFVHAADKCAEPYPKERYGNEAIRLLGVLEGRLAGRDFIMDGGYTIADIATCPWVRSLRKQAEGHIDLADFPAVDAWLARCTARPAFETGRSVCAR